MLHPTRLFLFFFNDTATTEIYTLSLHDALPICAALHRGDSRLDRPVARRPGHRAADCGIVADAIGARDSDSVSNDAAIGGTVDRKSTRLNSSHLVISYAVFCLKKKKIRNKRLLI